MFGANKMSNVNHQQQAQQLSYLLDDNMNLTGFYCPLGGTTTTLPSNHFTTTTPATYPADDSMMQEKYSVKVFVKSSAHVSYIVGKQGSKIRQIRQETGTFIQTPVNGEEPIFIITGGKNQVNIAKARLEEASNEYDFNVFVEACTYKDGDKVRNNLFLPARYIGLVVGKKGIIIKRIMDLSGTTIVTPKVNTLNAFKIYGTPAQIRTAINLIKDHILTTNKVFIEEIQQNQVEITLDIKENVN